MAVAHMTEAELVSSIADVMRQVRQGSEIVVEQGTVPLLSLNHRSRRAE